MTAFRGARWESCEGSSGGLEPAPTGGCACLAPPPSELALELRRMQEETGATPAEIMDIINNDDEFIVVDEVFDEVYKRFYK